MICFLTSSLNIPGTGTLNPANHLADEMRLRFPEPCRGLYIASDPEDRKLVDFYGTITKGIFQDAGYAFERYDLLDSRNEAQAAKLVGEANLIILTGGHVPTQNRFFRKIGLRRLLKGFPGVVVGISAGSMNGAEEVYAQPERAGEAVDPAYQRFLPGLALTKVRLLPHYQENKDEVLDGMRIYEDIACADSMGRSFYAVPDGSYLFVEDSREELRGEAYRICDGVMEQIAGEGDVVVL